MLSGGVECSGGGVLLFAVCNTYLRQQLYYTGYWLTVVNISEHEIC